MTAVQKLIEEARELSPKERRELIRELNALEQEEGAPVPPPPRYSRTLALAGQGRSDHADVAGDKYPHLGDAFKHDSDD
jgi:hypothetical protein